MEFQKGDKVVVNGELGRLIDIIYSEYPYCYVVQYESDEEVDFVKHSQLQLLEDILQEKEEYTSKILDENEMMLEEIEELKGIKSMLEEEIGLMEDEVNKLINHIDNLERDLQHALDVIESQKQFIKICL